MWAAGACFGAGLDIIAAADIRYCSADTYFCVKEVDIAITADMGVLQRLPGLIGQGMTQHLHSTGSLACSAYLSPLAGVQQLPFTCLSCLPGLTCLDATLQITCSACPASLAKV